MALSPRRGTVCALVVFRHLPWVFVYQEHKAAWAAVNAAKPSAPSAMPATASAADLPNISAQSSAKAAADQEAAAEAAAAAAAASGIAGDHSADSANGNFMLGFQTPIQTEMAIKHADKDIMLMDATFGTSQRKVALYTILAIDDYGNAVPVFHEPALVTSQQDSATRYKVTGACTDQPSCSYPMGCQGAVCKHIV